MCIVEAHDSAVAECLMECTHRAAGTLAEAVLDSHSVYFVNRNVFLVSLKRRVSEVSVQRTSVQEDESFAIVHFRLQPFKTAVAVGIVTAPGTTRRLPSWLTSAVYNSVNKHGVCLLTGMWGDTKEKMSELCQNLPLATDFPIAQAWQGNQPAVAALKGFPLYTLILGRCHRLTMPAPESLPHYQKALDENWVPAAADWHRLMPEWRTWTQRQISWHSACNMDWGQVRCKRVDPDKWMAGLSQVVFWCGVAQQGWGAKDRHKAAWQQEKGKPSDA